MERSSHFSELRGTGFEGWAYAFPGCNEEGYLNPLEDRAALFCLGLGENGILAIIADGIKRPLGERRQFPTDCSNLVTCSATAAEIAIRTAFQTFLHPEGGKEQTPEAIIRQAITNTNNAILDFNQGLGLVPGVIDYSHCDYAGTTLTIAYITSEGLVCYGGVGSFAMMIDHTYRRVIP